MFLNKVDFIIHFLIPIFQHNKCSYCYLSLFFINLTIFSLICCLISNLLLFNSSLSQLCYFLFLIFNTTATISAVIMTPNPKLSHILLNQTSTSSHLPQTLPLHFPPQHPLFQFPFPFILYVQHHPQLQ